MSANKSDLPASMGSARNRLAAVMLAITSFMAILTFTAGQSLFRWLR